MNIDKELDTRGLNCPLPILKGQEGTDGNAERPAAACGRRTDSGSTRDFQAFAKQTGNELVEQQVAGERLYPRAENGAESALSDRPASRPQACFAALGAPTSRSAAFSR